MYVLDTDIVSTFLDRHRTTPKLTQRILSEPHENLFITRLGLKIVGLLGILIEPKQKNLVIAIKPLMDTLVTTSAFRISSDLYDRILDVADETVD